DAGRVATLDLILQAGALARIEHVIGAGAQLEVTIDDGERGAAGSRRVIGPEILRAVGADAARDLQAREARLGIETEDEEVLVVGELDVELRLMLLDEV